MANMMKVSMMKDIGHLDMHYKRGVPKGHYGNPDIDQDRLDEDRINFAPTRFQKDENGDFILDTDGNRIEQKMTERIKEEMTKIETATGRAIRKDAVKMVCWVIDAPKDMSNEDKPRFFQETYNFLTERYGAKSGMGEDVCLSCFWHRSESTDHIHFAFMPIIERNGHRSFCAKEVVGRDDLKTFHTDLENRLMELGICHKGDILNGNTIRDSNGRALSVRELKAQGYNHSRSERAHTNNSRWSNNNNSNIERKTGRW